MTDKSSFGAGAAALSSEPSPAGGWAPLGSPEPSARFGLPRAVRLRPRLQVIALSTALLLTATLYPALLAPSDPLEADARAAFLAPSFEHLLGTDENGRDLLSRIIHGTRASLLVGVGATLLGLAVGVPLGLTAGLGHRWVNGALMRFVDVLLAFPDLLLALVIITFWGEGLSNTIFAIGVASVPRYARMVHAQTQLVRRASYVEAARALGLHPITLTWRHVLPNSVKPVLLLALIGVGGKIAAGASLSFLGFGAAPPAPEWGSMIAAGRNFLGNAWWITVYPGLAITLTVLSITALGRECVRRSEGKS